MPANETALATRQSGPTDLIEQVVIQGDLSKLAPAQRASYYAKVCETMGLNPFSRPFDYLSLNGKLVLYARKDATDQLRSIRRVSLTIASREIVGDLYVVTARATLPDGRCDEEIGAVSINGLRGEALANAMMKASTKAKRRVTLSIVGLGWLDESEVSSIPDARPANVDENGVIHEEPAALPAQKPTDVEQAQEDQRKRLHEEARSILHALQDRQVDVTPPTRATTPVLTEWLEKWKPQLERVKELDAKQAALKAAVARSHEQAERLPRQQAVIDEMDAAVTDGEVRELEPSDDGAAVAEWDALGREQAPEPEPVSDVLFSAAHQAKKAEAAELAEKCRALGMKVVDPHPQATELALDDYIVRQKRALANRGPGR